MSAIKRIEKLLGYGEKRAVQSATAHVRSASRIQQRERQQRKQVDDQIVEVAKVLSARRGGEAVIAKGTGKAIPKVMQVGLWFQERPQYTVRLNTASTAAIDDVQVDVDSSNEFTKSSASVNDLQPDHTGEPRPSLLDMNLFEDGKDSGDYTRVRHLSVLEIHIGLR